MSDKDNTNVYVSGLPSDITPPEFIEMMAKYGLIMNDPRTKKPKAKLYMDENGQPKGDARCCFIKVCFKHFNLIRVIVMNGIIVAWI